MSQQKQRRTVLAACGSLLVAPQLMGQTSARTYRIAHLSGSGVLASWQFLDAFRNGMRALGYAEPGDYVLEERYAEGKTDRLTALAQELVERRPDLMLVSTTPASLAAKAVSSNLPMVMVLVADPLVFMLRADQVFQ